MSKKWQKDYSVFKNKSNNFNFITSLLDNCNTKEEALSVLKEHTGGLSSPSKMPCHSYNLPAQECKVGKKLVTVKNSTCNNCYALKGRYNFGNVKNAMYTRFNLLDKKLWKEALTIEIALREKSSYFRWHDSGDLQDESHLNKIIDIAEYLPNIKFWLPTREYKLVDSCTRSIPKNLVIRQSAHMNDSYKEVKNKNINSIVVSDENIFTNMNLSNAKVCHATRKNSSHKCEECRECWNENTQTIAYLKH